MKKEIAKPVFIRRQRDFQVEKILKKRRMMTTALCPAYRDRLLRGHRFNRFCEDLAVFLSKKIDIRDLKDSVRYLAGSRPTARQIDELCWRLAGNERRLARHENAAVPPWRYQTVAEWVPAQISSVELCRGGRRSMELGYRLTFQILAGTPCPLSITQWWSRKKCFYMARYRDDQGSSFCFSKPTRNADRLPEYPFVDGRQFTTLRCLLLIEPALSTEGKPGFRTIAFSSAFGTWNREQQRYRLHREMPYLCPQGFHHTFPCHRCYLGLEHCRAAVHARTYIKKACPVCQEANAFFDPAKPRSTICVNCANRSVLEPEGVHQ